MSERKFRGGHGEEPRLEHLFICLVLLDIASSPTCIHQLPLPAINANGIPCVVTLRRRDLCAAAQRDMPKPFAMTSDLPRLEARVGCQYLEQSGVIIAHSGAFYDCILDGRPANTAREKRHRVIGDIVV